MTTTDHPVDTAAALVADWRGRAARCRDLATGQRFAAVHDPAGPFTAQHRRAATRWDDRAEQWTALASLLEVGTVGNVEQALSAARRLAEGLVSP